MWYIQSKSNERVSQIYRKCRIENKLLKGNNFFNDTLNLYCLCSNKP